MEILVSLRLTIAKDEDNEAEFWAPTPAQVGREVSARLLSEDLDTGWHVSGVQWGS